MLEGDGHLVLNLEELKQTFDVAHDIHATCSFFGMEVGRGQGGVDR